MLRVSAVSRDRMAVPAYGNVWYVDKENGALRENLGRNRPAFSFGETFDSLDAAAASNYKDFAVQRLPETLRLPDQTPLINRTKEHIIGNHPLSRITLLTFDLAGRGLNVEDHLIVGVDFSLPAPELIDLVDMVATNIYLQKDTYVRISITYKRSGELLITENPSVLQNGTFSPWKNAMAFFHHSDAVKEAERIEAMLRRAADWRSREVEFPAISKEDAAKLRAAELARLKRA